MFKWPPSFALARAYVDQLERSNGLPAARISSIRQSLAAAESSGNRQSALTTLASAIERDAAGSSDAAKVRALTDAVRRLAGS